MKVACYTRVSTAEQANEGYSLEEQAERLKKYCSAMGWDVYNVYVDGGFSGASLERPALKSLIADVQSHMVDKVVVYKLDRLSRSQKDTLFLIEDVFLANNCDFVSMSENFDTSTPFGKAMIGILAVFAQLEREQIKERMQMGKDARAKMGLFHGSGVIPIGYSYTDGQLVINDFEALQIRKIFELYASGLGYMRIADELNNAGLHHRYGEWSRKVVRYAILNKIYIGMIPHKGSWYKGIHEPIIDKELWDKVESRRLKKVNAMRHVNSVSGKPTSLLVGLLVCGHCGAKYTKMCNKGVTKKEGKKKYYKYECNSRLKRKENLVIDPNCKNKIWNMDELNQIIIDEVCKLELVTDDYLDNLRKSTKTEIEPIMRQISQIDEQISKLIDLYSMDQVPYEVIQKKINALSEQKGKLESEVPSVEQEQGKSLSNDDIREKVHSFSEMARNGTNDDLRAILFLLIDKIVLDGEDILIYWNF